MSIDLSKLRDPWQSVHEGGEGFVSELKAEVSENHILFDKEVRAIARRFDCDDVLFEYEGRLAVVHLTYAGREVDPYWPQTDVYSSWDEFISQRMVPDAAEYQTGDIE